MDRSSDSDAASVPEARRLFDELEDPGAPLTTADVAAELECPRPAASDALEAMADRGELRRKRNVSDTCVWWQDVEQRRERPRTATSRRSAIAAGCESTGSRSSPAADDRPGAGGPD